MAETSLQTFGSLISADLDKPASRRRWTWRRAFNASSLTARVLAVVAAVIIAAAVVFGETPLVAAVGVIALVPAALVDVLDGRLPNRMVAAAAGASIVAVGVSIIASGGTDEIALDHVAIGAGLMAGPLLALHLVSPASMGFGDVKAATVLGASVGLVEPELALVALFVASGATAAFGLARRDSHLPFGPGLLVGSVVALSCAPFVSTSAVTRTALTHTVVVEETR